MDCVCDIGCRYRDTLWFSYYPLQVENFQTLRITLSGKESCGDEDTSGFSQCKDYAKESPSLGSKWRVTTLYVSCTPKAYCYSSTALGPDAPELSTLRNFRDEVLAESDTGKKLVDLYYRYSPALISLLEINPGLRDYARERLAEIAGLIHEHLYGPGLGEGDYQYLRGIIEEGFMRLRDLADVHTDDPSQESTDNGMGPLLTEETLARINMLIHRLLDELSGNDPEFLNRQRDSAQNVGIPMTDGGKR